MRSRLSFLEATGIIVGAGVGAGLMAVPYLVTRAGVLSFALIIPLALALNIVLNLLLTEVLLRDGRDLQIVELMREYVFRGKLGAAVSWIVFAVLGLSFIASLTAYVVGAGDVLADLTGLSPLVARLAVYLFCAAIVFFGLKSVGVSEKFALFLLLAFVVLIAVFSVSAWRRPESLPPAAGWRPTLALFGVVMYSLNAAFAVPQAVKGLGRDARLSARAAVLGAVINATIITVVTGVAIAVSAPVTEVAVIGIAAATGPVVASAASLLVFAAMLTTYWSVSLALADIISQRTAAGSRLSWAIATAPTILLVLLELFTFVEYLQLAGGIVALVVVYVTVPMYLRARRERPLPDRGWRHGWLASPVVLTIFVLGMVLMAVGSLMGMGS
jgi:amino acid permease